MNELLICITSHPLDSPSLVNKLHTALQANLQGMDVDQKSPTSSQTCRHYNDGEHCDHIPLDFQSKQIEPERGLPPSQLSVHASPLPNTASSGYRSHAPAGYFTELFKADGQPLAQAAARAVLAIPACDTRDP